MSKTFNHAKNREAMEDREYDRQASRDVKESFRTMATRHDREQDAASREYGRIAFQRTRRA